MTAMQLIAGRSEASERSFCIVDPSTGEVFAQCPDASDEQLERAVAAARGAFPAWSALGWTARGEHLRRLATAMREQLDPLATLIVKEQGKPLADARMEISRAADMLDGFSRQRVESQVLRDDDRERIEEHFHASGVAAIISPWNVPIILFVMRMAPLLQAGNTVVGKPSPYTPLATLALGEIARDIFPAGVLNIVAGRDPLGQKMTEHPGIDRISFTGSVNTGKRVMASASGTLKRVGLELGGNDAAIVLDDVDIAEVAPKLLWAALRNCGQICMAVKRIYVPDALYEPMLKALAELAGKVVVGGGFEPGVQMGPLQNRMQFDLVSTLIEETRRMPSARIVCGGTALDRPGYFIAPTVVADLPDDARLVAEEQFGPVIPLLRYTDIEDAIRRANDTRFGLSASVWSSDVARASAVASRLEAGTVWVNNHQMLDIDTPFGGWKESGIGRGNGPIGLRSCMESNVVRVLKTPARV